MLSTIAIERIKKAADRQAFISLTDYLSIILGLLAVTAFIYFLDLESSIGLFELMPFVVGGFAVHALLPMPYRLPFFFFLTLAATLRLFGAKEGAVLLLAGMALWGIVRLPLPAKIRTRIILAAAGVLALLVGFGKVPDFSGPVIPVLGSIFMFRTILYLYEQRFLKEKSNLWLDLNYFFLLPNLIFFIFPVVDYKTFITRHYSKPALSTYRKGILWMANGVAHLLLYRLIYYYLIPAPSDVLNIYDLLQFMAASYALIVRLAGIFHFSAGVICLFGFDLPATFEHYFFAHSFSDLWRRINIYWRDFIMKVFYYPVYFKLKHLGPIRAMFITVLIIFVVNWFLHGYQWFWIKGAFPLTIQDAVFWAVFGIAVAINSIIQAKTPRKRSQPGIFSAKDAARLSLKVIGIFTFMSVLWSFWTSNDISEWWAMMRVAQTMTYTQTLALLTGLFFLVAIGVAVQYTSFKSQKHKHSTVPSVKKLFLVTIGLSTLSILAMPSVHPAIGTAFSFDTTPIVTTKLNAADQENLFKGYYENLLPNNNNPLMAEMESLQADKPKSWRPLRALGGNIPVEDIRLKKLKPNLDIIFKEAPFRTNEHGMHNPPVSKEKPANFYRIGLLGGSIELGGGIPMEQNMTQVAQAMLNNMSVADSLRFEMLNFAVTGYHPPEQVKVTEKVIEPFDLDALILTAHTDELRRIKRNLYHIIDKGYHQNYPTLNQIIEEAGLQSLPDRMTFDRKITPFLPEVYSWALQRIASQCKDAGVLPVLAYLFVPESNNQPEEEFEKLSKIAAAEGFITINLHKYVDDMKEEDLKIALWDGHLSLQAHQRYGVGLAKEIAKILNTTE
jgi:DNA-binding protein YbaB